jgi:hypothetical protein
MGAGMKTMLGGWEDVSRLLAQEPAGSADSLASLGRQRCVAVVPKENRSPPARAVQRSSSCKTRLGGLSVPLPPIPALERLAPRHTTSQRAFTRPALRAAIARVPSAAPVPRWALDDTCEIRAEDLVLLLRQPLPLQPSAVPPGAAGLRRDGTLLEPALQIIPAPTRELARPSLLQRVARWAKALLARR